MRRQLIDSEAGHEVVVAKTNLVQQIQLLDTDGVNLVEDSDHGHVNSISLDDINQIIDSGVGFMDRDLGIVDPVFRQHSSDTVVVDFSQGYRVRHQDLSY